MELQSRTYLVSNSLSSADLALYATLHPVLVCLPSPIESQCLSTLRSSLLYPLRLTTRALP